MKIEISICTGLMLNDHSNPYIESTTVLSDIIHIVITHPFQCPKGTLPHQSHSCCTLPAVLVDLVFVPLSNKILACLEL